MSRQWTGRFAVSGAFVGALLALRPISLGAQTSGLPAISVVAFSGSGVSSSRAGEMADELAARLVETGRFRVLLREWLPGARDVNRTPAAGLRQSAASAGVQYLVFGTVNQAVVAAPVGQAPRSSTAYRGIPAPIPGLMFPIRPVQRPQRKVMAVNVRVVDVSTGDVVRTAAAQEELTPRPLPPVMVVKALPRGPLTGLVAAALMIHAHKSPLDNGCQHAIADIAHTLQLPPAPPK